MQDPLVQFIKLRSNVMSLDEARSVYNDIKNLKAKNIIVMDDAVKTLKDLIEIEDALFDRFSYEELLSTTKDIIKGATDEIR